MIAFLPFLSFVQKARKTPNNRLECRTCGHGLRIGNLWLLRWIQQLRKVLFHPVLGMSVLFPSVMLSLSRFLTIPTVREPLDCYGNILASLRSDNPPLSCKGMDMDPWNLGRSRQAATRLPWPLLPSQRACGVVENGTIGTN